MKYHALVITRDFAERTRARVAETRAALSRLKEVSRDAIKQLDKINKQHTADRTRVYEKMVQLGDDLVEKLPDDASDEDSDRAHALQEEVHALASEVEEVGGTASAVEDLESLLVDAVREAFAALKEAESQLTKVERLGAKLGV